MNLTQKQLKQIIAEELRTLLSEQKLGPWLASQGMSDEEMAEMSIVPGWMDLMNMLREFNFKIESRRPGTVTWQRITERDDNGETKEEIQSVIFQKNKDNYRIATQGPWRVSLKLSGENWADHPAGMHIISYKDHGLEFAAEDIPYTIEAEEEPNDPTKGTTPGTGPFTNLFEDESETPKASHRGHQMAGMIMAGEAQFETVANYIRMDIVPMEDIVLAIIAQLKPVAVDVEKEFQRYLELNRQFGWAHGDYTEEDRLDHEMDLSKERMGEITTPIRNIRSFAHWSETQDMDLALQVDEIMTNKEVQSLLELPTL